LDLLDALCSDLVMASIEPSANPMICKPNPRAA
jgi:hypothetical protein